MNMHSPLFECEMSLAAFMLLKEGQCMLNIVTEIGKFMSATVGCKQDLFHFTSILLKCNLGAKTI